MGSETFTLQIDCIQSDVDQNFNTLIRFKTDSMLRVENHYDFTIDRRNNLSDCRFDCDPFTQCFASEGSIIHLSQWNSDTSDRRTQSSGNCRFFFSSRCCCLFCNFFFCFFNSLQTIIIFFRRQFCGTAAFDEFFQV